MIWQDEVDNRLVQHISKMNDVIRMQRKPCAVRQKISSLRRSDFHRKTENCRVSLLFMSNNLRENKHWVTSESSMPVHAAPSLPCNMVHWVLASMSPVSASCNTICDYSVPKRVHSARRNQKQQIDIHVLLHGGPAAPTMKLTSRRWRWNFSEKCWQWNFSEKRENVWKNWKRRLAAKMLRRSKGFGMRKFKENSTTNGNQIIETSSKKNGLPCSTP